MSQFNDDQAKFSKYFRNIQEGAFSEFQNLESLGSGSFGAVMKCKSPTGELVAVKESRPRGRNYTSDHDVFQNETKILQELVHPNIIKIHTSFIDGSNCYIVMELMDYDLLKVLKMHKLGLGFHVSKHVLEQILSGLAYIHEKKIIHRDLKPSNILVNVLAQVKISDFGVSASIRQNPEQLTPNVGTMSYRGPEILLGSQYYSFSLDLWSAGCIFAEMVSGNPLFHGNSSVSVLLQIFSTLNTPTRRTWPGIEKLPFFPMMPQVHVKNNIEALIPSFTREKSALTLLMSMLSQCPAKRITAVEALASDFFRGQKIVPLGNWNDGDFLGCNTVNMSSGSQSGYTC